MPTKAHKAAGARLCRVLAFAWASFAPQAFAFDSPLRSVAWHQLDALSRVAVVIGCVVIPVFMLCMLAAGGRKERRLGLALFGVLALLWGSYARLAGTVWYVRPTAGEYGAEDGSSYEAAFDGFGDVVWGVGGVQAWDTLKGCGSFGYVDRDGASNFVQVDVSGSSGLPVILDGDCSEHEVNPSTWTDKRGTLRSGAKLDGEGLVNHGIRTMANTDITIRNLHLTRFVDRSITLYANSATEKTTAKRITVEGNWLTANTDAVGAGDSMIDGRGTHIIVRLNRIEDAPGDGIFSNGANFTATENLISRVGSGSSVEGDCLQLTEYVDGGYVAKNWCDHRAADEKQCYIVNGESGDNGAFGFVENECDGYVSAATPGACAYLGSSGAWYATRNVMKGCDYSYRIAQMGATSKFYGNIGMDSASHGVYVGSAVTAANITHSVIARAGGDAYHSDTAGAAISFQNLVALGATGAGIDLADANNVENHNALWGNGETVTVAGTPATPHASDINVDPQFLGGPNPTTAEGFRLSASSPLAGTGEDLGDEIADFFGDYMYDGKWDIGVFRRDSCYRRSRDGKLDMARTRAQVVSRCLGIPGRYPEGL